MTTRFIFPSCARVIVLSVENFIYRRVPPINFHPIFVSIRYITIRRVQDQVPVQVQLRRVISGATFFRRTIYSLTGRPITSFKVRIFINQLLMERQATMFSYQFARRLAHFKDSRSRAITNFQSVGNNNTYVFRSVSKFSVIRVSVSRIPARGSTIRGSRQAIATASKHATTGERVQVFANFECQTCIRSKGHPLWYQARTSVQ